MFTPPLLLILMQGPTRGGGQNSEVSEGPAVLWGGVRTFEVLGVHTNN